MYHRMAWPPRAGAVVVALLLAGCAGAKPIPPPPPPPPPPVVQFKYETYAVQHGDTLYSIGRRFGVPWRKILAANKGVDPQNLDIGQMLSIPLHEATSLPLPPVKPPTVGPAELKPVLREALHKGKPGSAFWWPTSGRVTRKFDDPVRGFAEPGIGISAPAGTEVCAVAAGTVIAAIPDSLKHRQGWGNVVAIRHAGDVVSWYGQLDRILVKEGQNVGKGDRIGTVGASGTVKEPELALRFYKNERPVDPLAYLP